MSENLDPEELQHLQFIKNKFQIVDRIGEGTFSRVYKAIEIKTNKQVAIKAITKTSSPNRIVDELTFLITLNFI